MSSDDHLRSESFSKTLRIFLLLATIVIIGITIVLALNKQPEITQQSLQQEIASIQLQLPIRVDAYTELNDVQVSDKVIKYTFRVHAHTDQQAELNSSISIEDENFSQQVETSVKASACQNKDIRRYINTGISLSYRYLNQDNHPVAEFSIPAGFCSK
jgi:hypothetical protein